MVVFVEFGGASIRSCYIGGMRSACSSPVLPLRHFYIMLYNFSRIINAKCGRGMIDFMITCSPWNNEIHILVRGC